MQILLIVDNKKNWPLHIEGVSVVSAKEYISSAEFSGMKGIRVYNLCSSYAYQTIGYYVSLLAEARKHKPVPGIQTIQEMKSQAIVRFISEDLDRLIQKSLSHIKTNKFVLSVYFGKNVAKHYDKLSAKLFSIIRTPFLQARFSWQKNKWILQSLSPIAAKDIAEEHHYCVIDSAKAYFARKQHRMKKRSDSRFDLAILYNPSEPTSPSDEKAIKRFIKAADAVGFDAEIIGKEDYVRLAEYDALFIRETTAVNHHTFRFAQRAAMEGLVTIDDPESILKCTNKVFLAELLKRHEVPAPKTVVVSRTNLKDVASSVGFPCIIKQPDSSFSQGVLKAADEEEFGKIAKKMLAESELIIAQQYTPSDFDWRIGILDKKVLYCCKYFMVPGHWQVINHNGVEGMKEGSVECVPIDKVPEKVINTALKAANLIGDGLYGVDLKQVGNKVYIIEVNDNPSIEHGFEDRLVKEELYLSIMKTFLARVEAKKREKASK